MQKVCPNNHESTIHEIWSACQDHKTPEQMTSLLANKLLCDLIFELTLVTWHKQVNNCVQIPSLLSPTLYNKYRSV